MFNTCRKTFTEKVGSDFVQRLHYEISFINHELPWIVLIHGAGGSIATWKLQWQGLSNHFNLLAIDLRDHGKSKNVTPPYASYNFEIVSNDIIDVLDHEGIDKAHFVTLSFGSVMLQALHQRRPDLIQKMVMIGGVFNANWMIKGFVHLARFFNLFLSFKSMYSTFSYLLMPRKRNQVARRVYQMQARRLAEEEYLKWLGLYSEFFMLLKKFHAQEIQNDILVLMGVDDYLFLPSARNFSKNRDQIKLRIVAGAGHICNIDKPAEVNKQITDFLNTQQDQQGIPETKVRYDTN